MAGTAKTGAIQRVLVVGVVALTCVLAGGLRDGATAVVINFDSISPGFQAPNFLGAFGIPNITSVAPSVPGSGPFVGLVSPHPTGSPPNAFWQGLPVCCSAPGDVNTMTLFFSPGLTGFGLTRMGTADPANSISGWTATFYDAANAVLGSFGEPNQVGAVPPLSFSFSAPVGQIIAKVEITTIYDGGTFSTVHVDDLVLVPVAPPVVDKVAGSYTRVDVFPSSFRGSFDVLAHLEDDEEESENEEREEGTASGHVKFASQSAGRFTGKVTCLNVVGNEVAVGFRILKSTNPNYPVGSGLVAHLFDGGDPVGGQGVDGFSFDAPLPSPPTQCPAPRLDHFTPGFGNYVISVRGGGHRH